MGAWVPLGREGGMWGWRGEDPCLSMWISGDMDAVCPCICMVIKKLQSTDTPVLLPHSGVHEDIIDVHLDCA